MLFPKISTRPITRRLMPHPLLVGLTKPWRYLMPHPLLVALIQAWRDRLTLLHRLKSWQRPSLLGKVRIR